MELTRKEEYRNKKVSIAVTALAFVVMVSFLIFKTIITADTSSANTVANEIMLDVSNGNNTNFNEENKSSTPALANKEKNSNEKTLTDPDSEKLVENGASTLANKYKRITISNTKQTIHTEDLLPLSTEQTGIETTNTGEASKFGFNLKGRTIVTPPKFPKDTKEEGKVIVEIVVDKYGNVTEADPSGRGTTTSSSELKAKAKQLAYALKFNAIASGEEQRGSVTVIFSFD